MPIYTDSGEPKTLKDSMTSPNGHLWKMSVITELNHILSRNTWITTKRSVVIGKGRKPVPIEWVLKSMEEPDRLIRLKSRNLVKGYLQVPVVDYTESF